jgi:hypothetical protein
MRTDASYKLHGHHFRRSAEQHFDSSADVHSLPIGMTRAERRQFDRASDTAQAREETPYNPVNGDHRCLS